MAASMPPTVPKAARPPHQNIGRRFYKSGAWCEDGAASRLGRCELPTLVSTASERHLSPAPTHRPSPPLVLARSPSRDPWRHGCRHGADKDVLAACPAMVGGQGPCCQTADQLLSARQARVLLDRLAEQARALSTTPCRQLSDS
ncbi:conserved hypothetical protein [Xanthomonas oryzae pv. oryzae MAFF 311018]|nr:conserved hypothetical protein [Xanthomonas oryzae pv. oryzae MAFF 311018]